MIPLGEAGILADFDGDGEADFISTGKEDGLLRIWHASGNGQFTTEPRTLLQSKFDNPHTMTTGDFDLDGDLDLFIGQWKEPYLKGSMPTPYYDANDGYPDALLINDGKGNFTDGTKNAGLEAKRNRRTYSASFADLDGDNDLDLFCVCDFSGIDVYLNDGKGKFTDVTDTWVKQRHAFGMAHTVADFNGDGALDVYMVGMSSTTARRLDRLNLGRDGFEKYDAMRAPMTYGNRLYFGSSNGLQQPALSDDVARTGWSWGTGSADFDNDGDLDLYVANGHLSGNSALDYCTRFWCHDVYTGTSKPNQTLDTFFSGKLSGLGSNYSWNGFEHNHLFLNKQNSGFHNVAFLLGTAFEFDARACRDRGHRCRWPQRSSCRAIRFPRKATAVVRNEKPDASQGKLDRPAHHRLRRPTGKRRDCSVVRRQTPGHRPIGDRGFLHRAASLNRALWPGRKRLGGQTGHPLAKRENKNPRPTCHG